MSQPGHDLWEVPDPLFVTREGEKAPFTPSGPAAKLPDLRAFLLSAFLQMAMGVALSAATATLVAVDPALQAWLVGPTGLSWAGWIVMLAPLGLVILLGARVERLSGGAARWRWSARERAGTSAVSAASSQSRWSVSPAWRWLTWSCARCRWNLACRQSASCCSPA